LPVADVDAAVTGYVPVAEVVRNGFVEGVHFGAVVALNADGTAAFSSGDVERPMHPRSANKLMQAAGMRGLGLELEGEFLALSAASHWGEPRHIDGVRTILRLAGLDESALQVTPSLPGDPESKRRAVVAELAPAPIMHGCSGKHAAMLATCADRGWSTADYLEPDHPLQRELRAALEGMTGVRVTHEAVDGCGAPAWAIPLTALARAYRDAVLAPETSALGAVAGAMRAHPEYVCGEESEVTGLMRAVPGLLVKDGAEAVYAAALPDGRAVAVKIADGGFRAGQAVLVAALMALDAAAEPGADADALHRWGMVPVLGHGEPVGAVRAVGW
jgi:L-asparaginase II